MAKSHLDLDGQGIGSPQWHPAVAAVEVEVDEAGNQWWTLRGESDRAVLIGGHIDSVPNGGWLDGCLNVLAGVEVLRRIAGEGTPPATVRLVDWADEEGARFGRSLFGSSACAGTLVSVASDGTQANGTATGAAISADGRFVAFASFASDLIAGAPDPDGGLVRDAFVRDLTSQSTEMISRTPCACSRSARRRSRAPTTRPRASCSCCSS